MQILTQDGFKDFDGFINNGKKPTFKVTFNDNTSITCTDNHQFLLPDGDSFLCLNELREGSTIYPEKTIVTITEAGEEEVFDALNVEETHSYWTDGVISHNCLYLDEFSFVENDYEFYESTYPVITSGKTTKVIITSTPKGIGNMFYKIFEGSRQGINSFKNMTVTWKDVPGRDEAWKKETIANTSPEQFRQEFECEFLGSSNTLINANKLIAMVAKSPLKSNTDSNTFIYEAPEPGHGYIMTVDVSKGRGRDSSAFSIIDITSRPFKQVATFNDSMISPILLPTILVKTAQMYNNALMIIENNDAGAVVCNGVYYDHEYENMFVESMVKAGGIGVTQTKKTKAIGCSNLKDLVETNNIIINDKKTIEELSNFEGKGNSYAAAGSGHDDMVMTLVLFSWFISTVAFTEYSADDLKKILYNDRQYEIENELLSFGFLTSTPDHYDERAREYEQMKENLQTWQNL